MELPPIIKQANDTMQGWPEYVVTGLLIAAAVLIIIIALFSSPLVKAVALAWILMP